MGTFSTCRWYTSIVPYCTILYRLYHIVPYLYLPVPYCTALVLPVPSSSTLVPHCTTCTGTCTACTACTGCTVGQPNLYRMYCSSTTVPDVPQAVHFVQNLTLHETYKTGAVTDYTSRKSTSGRSVTTKSMKMISSSSGSQISALNSC